MAFHSWQKLHNRRYWVQFHVFHISDFADNDFERKMEIEGFRKTLG